MAKKQAGGRIPDEVQPAFDAISRLVDDFCREHLNEEYAVLCRKLTEKLARKRPSPLVSGKPSSVSFLKVNDSSIPKECASECDERWSYYDAVIHEASSTEMNLEAFMNDGKCVFVKVL